MCSSDLGFGEGISYGAPKPPGAEAMEPYAKAFATAQGKAAGTPGKTPSAQTISTIAWQLSQPEDAGGMGLGQEQAWKAATWMAQGYDPWQAIQAAKGQQGQGMPAAGQPQAQGPLPAAGNIFQDVGRVLGGRGQEWPNFYREWKRLDPEATDAEVRQLFAKPNRMEMLQQLRLLRGANAR